MKSLKLIVGIIVISIVALCDLAAQTSSSAKQTVTFGVQRLAPVLLSSAQPSSLTLKLTNVVSQNPLKVSVGSGVQAEMSVDLGISAGRSLASTSTSSHRSDLPPKKFPTTTFDQSVITLTE